MSNKVMIVLSVPELDEAFDMFIPVNIRVGTLLKLINRALNEMTNGLFIGNNKRHLYDAETSKAYDSNALIRKTGIRNGTKLIIL